jgi:hypothetical protein
MKIGEMQRSPAAGTRSRSAARVIKLSGSSSLRREPEHKAGTAAGQGQRRPEALPFRYETVSAQVQAQDGIQAGFVAQVLGQILETKRANPLLAAQAYARKPRDRWSPRLIRIL